MRGETGGAAVERALAVARVTGLITQDTITQPIRDAILHKLPRGKTGDQIAYLLTCPWCASIWVAGVAVPLFALFGKTRLVRAAVRALALSQVAGMVHSVGRD